MIVYSVQQKFNFNLNFIYDVISLLEQFYIASYYII